MEEIIDAVLKLLLSMVLGAMVGLERRHKGQIAGMRTFALISMGATLAMLVSIYIPEKLLGLTENGDPGRIAAQVISGIGFLGAGAIIQMKGSVRGLTTAAGMWMTASIGLAVGAGMYVVAVIASLLIILVLTLLELCEKHLFKGKEQKIVRLKVNYIVTDASKYRQCFSDAQVHISDDTVNVSQMRRCISLTSSSVMTTRWALPPSILWCVVRTRQTSLACSTRFMRRAMFFPSH